MVAFGIVLFLAIFGLAFWVLIFMAAFAVPFWITLNFTKKRKEVYQETPGG